MMKKAQIKDFFREIRRSLNRYLSILFIVALGVAFYAGVRSAEPDMKLSADSYYDDVNLMDMRVVGTLGLTDADVSAIGEIEGITAAEGGYSTFAMTDNGGTHSVVSVQSISKDMNRLTLQSGRLPEKADECFLDQDYMDAAGIELGDTITVYADDSDILDTLSTDTFTVVGSGSYAWYLSWDRGTADIGNGDVRFFVMVPPEAFSLEAYTVAYMTADAADGLICFDDAYKNHIADITERVEAIAQARSEVRLEEVKEEGAEKIADAKVEIADAEAELADARQQLADAEVQLADASKEIADGEAELADGEAELADAKAEVRRNEKKISDGFAELADGKAKLADAAQEIADAELELSGGAAQVSNGRAELSQKRAEFNAFAAQAEGLKTQAGYQAAQQNYAALQQMQAAGLPMTAEQQAALGFYGQVLPQIDAALAGAAPTDAALAGVVEGMLQPVRAQLSAAEDQLSAADRELEAGREQLAKAKREYEDAQAEIAENEQKLTDGEKEIADAKKKIRSAEKDLVKGRQELAEGKQEYADARIEYSDAQAEFDEKSADADTDIADAKRKVLDAQKDLDELEMPEWFVLDRESIQSYVEYGMDTERIGAIGIVFPSIFFLVAALVSLTTMTRMVEEERLQIGTLKALGYSQLSIASKYLGYALSASVLGGVLGIALGSSILPYVIMSAYRILYTNLHNMLMPIQWDLSGWAMGIAVLCTVLATYLACYAEFMATPAALMRPTAPAQGKRVLLERVGFLWKRLSFTQKATFRNLFRYKKRFFMTIFGIGACMGLLLVAFGLRNSISEIVDKQYKTVWTYDTRVSFDENDQSALPQLMEDLAATQGVAEMLPVRETSIDVRANGMTKGAYVFVPEQMQNLDSFVRLRSRTTDEKFHLTDEGVIITEKLARLLSLRTGDTLELMRNETEAVSVRITAVAENYLHHYVYITPTLYQSLFHEAPAYSTVFLRTEGVQEAEMGERLLKVENVAGVSFISDLQKTVSEMMRSLDMVVWVLVISAGLLAFIVLYNLNNISIIERRRELATLKVLGFYDGEVGAYVYRENVWLTLIGIALGMAIGFVLHKFVIRTCEVDMIMFGQNIRFMSYVYSIALTFLFAVIVNLFMFFKLKKIDMVESLKSVE